MFAGPNGSGKSTIKSVLSPELIGVYVNPDEIQLQVANNGMLDFANYQIAISQEEVRRHFLSSTLAARCGLTELPTGFSVKEQQLFVPSAMSDSYVASILADFLRQKLLRQGVSFTFETVMSSPDKIEFLDQAQRAGFRTYLYYVATEDPAINIWRVKRRVELGGHNVPHEKIIARYNRSLALLIDAIRRSDRAYLFDNSGAAPVWIAEITSGKEIQIKSDVLPNWFKAAVWDKLPSSH